MLEAHPYPHSASSVATASHYCRCHCCDYMWRAQPGPERPSPHSAGAKALESEGIDPPTSRRLQALSVRC